MISRKQAELLISDCKSLHQALLRNGYYAPSLKSALMSWEFMDGVREGRYWLPQQNDCRLKKIAMRPPLKTLAEIVAPLIEADANSNETESALNNRNAMMATAERLRKFYPDADWMISVTYTLDPGNQLFAKDFVWQPKPTKAAAMEQLDNSSGFFDGLPLSKNQKKGRGATLGTRRLTKVEREQQRIKQLEAKIAEQQERFRTEVAKCQQRIQDEEMQERLAQQLKSQLTVGNQGRFVVEQPGSPTEKLIQTSQTRSAGDRKQRGRRPGASRSPNARTKDVNTGQ